MIRYRLSCEKGHAFEGWFRSSDDYDRQRKRRLVSCPSCGSTKVQKAIMAPNVVTSEQAGAARKRKARQRRNVGTAEAPAANEHMLAVTAEQREAVAKLKALRDAMLESSDYVGPRFAEEARRIHEDATPRERGIHGEASPEDVKSLLEDGITVLPIPSLPDDNN